MMSKQTIVLDNNIALFIILVPFITALSIIFAWVFAVVIFIGLFFAAAYIGTFALVVGAIFVIVAAIYVFNDVTPYLAGLLPWISCAIGILGYVAISLFENASGRYHVFEYWIDLKKLHISAKILSFASVLLVAPITHAIFFLISFANISNSFYLRSSEALSIIINQDFDEIFESYVLIYNTVGSYDFGYFVLIIYIIWFLFVYFGFNYIVTRSVYFTLGVFALAFALDIVFTVLMVTLKFQGSTLDELIEFLNRLNYHLKSASFFPIESVKWIIPDHAPLVEHLLNFAEWIQDFCDSTIRMVIYITIPEEGSAREFMESFVEFSKTFEVDFLFFVAASVIVFLRYRLLSAQ